MEQTYKLITPIKETMANYCLKFHALAICVKTNQQVLVTWESKEKFKKVSPGDVIEVRSFDFEK